MSTARLVFLAGALGERDESERLALVERFYGAPVRIQRAGRVIRGVVELPALGGSAPAADWWWGTAPPAGLDSEPLVVRAGDEELRRLDAADAIVAIADGRARVVEGAGVPSVLCASAGTTGVAWATHAVAAALLAHGRATIDNEAVRDLLALEAPLGERTLVRQARVLRPGTCVDLAVDDPVAFVERSFWAPADRWSSPDEPPEQALTEHLRARPPGADAWLGLTAGRDSNALLAVAHRAGVAFRCFTWGDVGVPDVDGARATGELLGVEHETLPYRTLDDEGALGYARELIRLTDGCAAVGAWARASLPAGARLVATGAGGELARAFHYLEVARNRRRPRQADLVAALARFATADVKTRIALQLERAADETGLRGWDVLDAFYLEHRMGRWGRPRIVPLHGSFWAPMTQPRVAAALVALPLEERLTGAWHRRMADPRIVLPDTRPQRRGVPAVMRRGIARWRARRRNASGAWPWAPVIFAERPRLRAWAEELLVAPVLDDALGPERLAELRRDFRAGVGPGTQHAMQMAGVAALAAALEEAGA